MDKFYIPVIDSPHQYKCKIFTNRNSHFRRANSKHKYDRIKFPLRHKRQLYIIKLIPGYEGYAHFLIYDSFTRKRLSIQDSRIDLKDRGPSTKIHTLFMRDMYQVSSLLRDIAQKGSITKETRFIRNGYSIYNVDTFETAYKRMIGVESEFENSPVHKNYKINMSGDGSNVSKSKFRDNETQRLRKRKSFFSLILFRSVVPKNKIFSNFQHKILMSSRKSNIFNSTYSNEGQPAEKYSRIRKKGRHKKNKYNWCSIKLATQFIMQAFNILFPSLTIFSVSMAIIIIQWTFYYIRMFSKKNKYLDALFMHFSGRNLKNNVAIYGLLTSTVLHSSLGHLLISTIMHFRFSFVMENTHGSIITLTMYFICSIYGMLTTCCYNKDVKQANGFAGDWGVAGILLSGYLFNFYLMQGGKHHLTNFATSFVCLFFVKASDHGDQISLYTHIMSSVCGLCFGYLFNKYGGKLRRGRFGSTVICDIICLSLLLALPAASIIALFVFDT
ncbi:hypothetical protein BMR1_02g01230 [Babesia microti strain RI]|uniref:Peptidase S54 rhomboid domain-containing protein n=1 Tax=Babesia microti (strain RI) TaxID=1133968 RepID=A0A1R4AA85_BABMR|nr:hypothetical protein BMR1_02g01230 [Babesia microti strain RI]SJK85887.1 hypothetical protein BMR1_02g01230 [Babesia microti strain RI]|eukprot:XP_021338098.1 hypothetical protein BMR1_02g01230 [Babesia microti strain RI]